jgi:hypothetical protein
VIQLSLRSEGKYGDFALAVQARAVLAIFADLPKPETIFSFANSL